MSANLKNAVVAAVVLGLFAGVSPAFASVINATCSNVPLQPTELFSATMTCSQFDSSTYGTLNSVTITVNGYIEGTISLTNNAQGTQSVSASTTSDFYLGPLNGFSITNPIMSLSFSTGLQSIASGATYNSPTLFSNGSWGPMTTSTGLASYEGLGTFDLVVSTLSGFGLVGGGSSFNSLQSLQAQANAVVSYEYGALANTVPEPSSIALLGIGLMGFGFMVRRRRTH